MPDPLQADVIVPVYRDTGMTVRCLESVLAHSGPVLRWLIVVDDASPEPDMLEALAQIARSDPRVRVLRNEDNLGYVATCNRGLRERSGDAVLLNSDTLVTPGWLSELAEVTHSDPRTACVSPLSNHASICSVPAFCEETPASCVDVEAVRAACAGLPRWTEIPAGNGFCLYLRGEVVDLVGPLDPVFARGYNEENDWALRAQAMGFVAKRANRAFVYHLGSRSFGEERLELEQRNARLLAKRHPHYRPQVDRFYFALDSRLPAQAVQVETTGRMRVALDLRHVPLDQVGTATYAINLVRALSKLPEIELTLVVRDPRQAAGVPARVTLEQNRLYDVEVIHKPAQVFDPADLRLLFGSPAHAIITHLDLIAHRAQAVFPDQAAADRYRTTSALALQAAQAIIAISEDARREIVAEFGLPAEEIVVTPLGVEHDRFAEHRERDRRLLRSLAPPDRFFLSATTDFPHKNLHSLVEAHALLRRRWSSAGEPPGLILVGNPAGIKDGFYRHLSEDRLPEVLYFGAVTDDQLLALYRSAEALVFPSVYEGSCLPMLDAMAAGTPIIAMPFSSVPEVGGDCVLYPDGLSVADLARAMERLAADGALRVELRDRGLRRIQQFTWERTARATFEVYRSAVLRPTSRSLQMRRLLSDSILSWSEPLAEPQETGNLVSYHPVVVSEPVGIRTAWKALNFALQRRIRREMKRLYPVASRRSA